MTDFLKAVLLMKEAVTFTGMSRCNIYLAIKRGDFPRPIQLSPRRIGFLRTELESWIKNRPRGVGAIR